MANRTWYIQTSVIDSWGGIEWKNVGVRKYPEGTSRKTVELDVFPDGMNREWNRVAIAPKPRKAAARAKFRCMECGRKVSGSRCPHCGSVDLDLV